MSVAAIASPVTSGVEANTKPAPHILHVKNPKDSKITLKVPFNAEKIASLSFCEKVAFEIPPSIKSLSERANTLEKAIAEEPTLKEKLIKVALAALSVSLVALAALSVAGVIGLTGGAAIGVALAAWLASGFISMIAAKDMPFFGFGSGLIPLVGWLFILEDAFGTNTKKIATMSIEYGLSDAIAFYKDKGADLLRAIDAELSKNRSIAAELQNIPADPHPDSNNSEALRARAHFVAERQRDHARTLEHISYLETARTKAQEAIAYCASISQ